MSKPKQQVIAPAQLIEKANGLDVEIRRLWREMDEHLNAAEIISIPFGKACTEMHDMQLHKYVRKHGSKKGYPSFPEYIKAITNNKLSKSAVYMAMGLHKLTEGPNPLAPEEIAKMPKDNAYRLSTLEPEERTPELIAAAKKTPKEDFPQRVQESLNAGKPLDRQTIQRVDFYRKLHPKIAQMLEDCIEDFCHFDAIRDGDDSLTLQEKSIAAIVTSARTHCADLLQELERNRAKEKAAAPDLAESVPAEEEGMPSETEERILASGQDREYEGDFPEIVEREYVPIEEAEASAERGSSQDFS